MIQAPRHRCLVQSEMTCIVLFHIQVVLHKGTGSGFCLSAICENFRQFKPSQMVLKAYV